jgi:hypothetical protein
METIAIMNLQLIRTNQVRAPMVINQILKSPLCFYDKERTHRKLYMLTINLVKFNASTS